MVALPVDATVFPMSQRSVLIAAAMLAVVAGVWLLPRTFSSGAAMPPASIELRSERTPTASPTASSEPPTVDERDDRDDDGDNRAERDRRERRSNRESVPQAAPVTGGGGDDGADDDDGGDDDDDDDDGGDDDLGDDGD